MITAILQQHSTTNRTMTDQNTPDSFNPKPLTETIRQEVLAALRKDGFLPTKEVVEILTTLQEATKRLEEQYHNLKASQVTQEDIPAPLERFSIRSDMEEKINDFDIARSDLIAHCFKLMLLEGISWKDIMGEIGAVIPGNNQETMAHLYALEELALTASDFI